MGKTVADVETIFNSISGYDARDSTSIPDTMRTASLPLKKKIGIPRSFLSGGGIDKDVLENFEKSCELLKQAGYDLVDVSLPTLKYSLAVYYIIMPAEVSSNLARYDGIRYGLSVESEKLFDVYAKTRGIGFGREARRRILLGTYILSHGYHDAYYNKALKVRDAITAELTNIFREVDALITPTVPFQPFKLGAKLNDPLAMYLCDIFSAPANLANIPALSLPSGMSADGLPFGIQITAPYLREDILFAVGKDFEKEV
jgi:aspartyl-tRNA(Asn)/glutamyl-tRNA(Gln) amidotransferase subunit A